MCFRKIVHDSWYHSKCTDQNDEKIRLVSTAGEVVSSDIRAMPCDLDDYPPPSSLKPENLIKTTPQSLTTLVEKIIAQPKKQEQSDSLKRKGLVVSQIIMSLVRPRSYLLY